MKKLTVIDYGLNLTSRESLIVKKNLIDNEIQSLISHLKKRIIEKAKIHNELVACLKTNKNHRPVHTNDETMLVIHSRQPSKHFTRKMLTLSDSAELGIAQQTLRKINHLESDGARRWRRAKET